ncbi:RNA pyrophosphohydrolase [Candidatus Xenohaliotis californiensis]|uniref:RNA pyrophosphohydrolase n=1 Tax=Candidatus Xenohaliotis californiensis TaxID=84677 RepID=A0ABM9N7I9_9RICK|nr:RNA pyrophosphohydrolase [Candidatus Xenohaliotis californiensis]
MTISTPKTYRPCVGIAMINKKGDVFVGKRVNDNQNIWQMPQGGINKNEAPKDAVYRELYEETSVQNAKIIAQMDKWLYYDIPKHISQRHQFSQYRGQKQMWFLMFFEGDIQEINVTTKIPEFAQWKWCGWDDVCKNVIFFKKNIYQQVSKIFQPIANKHIVKAYEGR